MSDQINTTEINTVSDLQGLYDGGVMTNDRGNGCAGPQYLPEEDARGEDSIEGLTPITVVDEEEDADAWRLARESAEANSLPAPTVVAVGKRNSGDNGYQQIFAV